MHLSNNHYKDKYFYNDFEEEVFLKKIKKKVNSKGESSKINNKINKLFNWNYLGIYY